MRPITIKIAFDRDNHEYRVPAPNGKERGAYYTNDRDDAEGTARLMYAGCGPHSFKIVRVTEWPK